MQLPVPPPLYKKTDDQTFYLDRHVAKELLAIGNHSASGTIVAGGVAGRSLTCLCNGGRHVSVTVRWGAADDKAPSPPDWHKKGVVAKELGNSMFKPPVTFDAKRPVSIDAICDKLFDLVFRNQGKITEIPHGLVVIAGQTASAKSKTARGLVYKLLTHDEHQDAWHKAKQGRRQHLLTLEDPIEDRLFPAESDAFKLDKDKSRLVDYTPRDRDEGDFDRLEGALHDALRQTPTAVYIGEVRERSDWEAVIEFAGSGHLVITTTHAGSVTEAMARLFDAAKAREHADVGWIAQRLLAVVHQAPIKCKGVTVLAPSLWKRTPQGLASVISDGLSSVLPHFPANLEDARATSSIGRRWFVKELLQTAEIEVALRRLRKVDRKKKSKDISQPVNAIRKRVEMIKREFDARTMELDLAGI